MNTKVIKRLFLPLVFLLAGAFKVMADLTLSIPVMLLPPQIDGTVDKSEWLYATQAEAHVSFETEPSAVQSLFFQAGRDKENLYCSFRISLPEKRKLGENDWATLQIRTLKGAERIITFQINSLGTGVCSKNGVWQKAVRTMPDSWCGEMAIPFSLLGRDPEVDEAWSFAFGLCSGKEPPERWTKNMMDGVSTVSGTFIFAGAGDPVVRMLPSGNTDVGQLSAVLEIIGGNRASSLNAELTFKDKDGRKVLGGEREIAVPAGLPVRLPVYGNAPFGDYRLHCNVSNPGTMQTIFDSVSLLSNRPELAMIFELPILPSDPITVTVDHRQWRKLSQDAEIHLALLGEKGNAVAVAKAAPSAEGGKTVLTIPAPLNTDSHYVMRATLSVKGKDMAEVKRPIQLVAKPPWMGNSIGITDDALPGWTPIRIEVDKAHVTSREYTLGKNGLPAAIKSRGLELLRGPINLLFNGLTLDWERQVKSQSGGKAIWESTAKNPQFNASIKTTLEFDGMLRYDLTLTPIQSPVTLKNLEMLIPYDERYAYFGRSMKSDKFVPNVIVRDFEVGLCWFAEWSKGWQIGKKAPMEIIQKADSLDWRIRFIGEEGKVISEPLTLTFGLQALPVRDFPFTGFKFPRRVYGVGPSHPDFSANNTLRYPLRGDFSVKQGAVAFRAATSTLDNTLMRLGGKNLSLELNCSKAEQARDTVDFLLKLDGMSDAACRPPSLALPFAGKPVAVDEGVETPLKVATTLEYQFKDMKLPEAGSLRFLIDRGLGDISFFQIGDKSNGIAIGFECSNRTQYDSVLYVGYSSSPEPFSNAIVKIGGIRTADCWLPVGLTWQRNKENVILSLVTQDPLGEIRNATESISWEKWQSAFKSGTLAFSGKSTFAVDDFVVYREALPSALFKELFTQAVKSENSTVIADSFDKADCAENRTAPEKGEAGRIMPLPGATISAESVGGRHGQAVLLPNYTDVKRNPILRQENYSLWFDVGMNWQEKGEKITLTLVARSPKGDVQTASGEMPAKVWRKLFSDEAILSFGGEKTMAISRVIASGTTIPDSRLLELLGDRKISDETLTLDDRLDSLRFSRGLNMTRPAKITAGGNGGLAGGQYVACYAKIVKDSNGTYLLLPAGVLRSRAENARALGVDYSRPHHEGWRQMLGWYGKFHVPSEVYKYEVERESQKEGLGLMTYAPLAVNGVSDLELKPFIRNLSTIPSKPTDDATVYCLNSPISDYIVSESKKSIDYYALKGFHLDNSINCRHECKNTAHGCGWKDEQGELHGRYPIFAARETMKRLVWLFHSYVKDGMLSLHAGARGFPPVGGLADMHQCGEGGMYMGNDFSTMLAPERTTDNYQYAFGTPLETLTKEGRNEYGPNFIYMYALLHNGSVRAMQAMLEPERWWINLPEKGKKRLDIGITDKSLFAPYYACSGIPQIACPMTLWWQLQDDFDTHSAEFIGYWRSTAYVAISGKSKGTADNSGKLKPQEDAPELGREGDDAASSATMPPLLSPSPLRCSLYLHPGKDALLVVANFGNENADAELNLNLSGTGLAGMELVAYDAFTDTPLQIKEGSLRTLIHEKQYRIIRIEKKQ